MQLEFSALEEQLQQQQHLKQIHSEPQPILRLHLEHQTQTLEQQQPALVPLLLGLELQLLLLLQVGTCSALGLGGSSPGPATHRGELPRPGGQESSRKGMKNNV